MYSILRWFLFRLDAEKAHHLTLWLLKWIVRLPFGQWLLGSTSASASPVRLFGLDFPNPVGLAAGLDKNAECLDAFARMGFGFVEIGTVTPLPQPGNEQPRLFRLVRDKAIINRMGFNNAGMHAVAANIRQYRQRNPQNPVIIGGNIGKNKVTPNEAAASDYLKCFETLFPWVDYFVVNVSSPNTPNLRELQDKEPLMQLLHALMEANARKATPKPILLKIAPDLTDSQLDDIVEIVQATKLAGVVATNTTIAREPLTTDKATVEAIGAGGLSGHPLTQRATSVIQYLHRKSGGSLPIIGVGGIMCPQDALDKRAAGANLVQLYTGFIYEGPALIKAILKAWK